MSEEMQTREDMLHRLVKDAHQQRLTAARAAMAEAAKRWSDRPRPGNDNVGLPKALVVIRVKDLNDALDAAVTALRAIEQETST